MSRRRTFREDEVCMWLEEEDTPVREQNDSVLPAMRAATVENSKSSALTWSKRLALIGPAFVAGAWQFGPGNLTSAVEAGSAYGYSLIWVIVLSTILMIAFTDMSVRIGIIARGSMIQTIKDTLGKPVGVCWPVSVSFSLLFAFPSEMPRVQVWPSPCFLGALRSCGHSFAASPSGLSC